jgi:small subunit ribosomal protein S17
MAKAQAKAPIAKTENTRGRRVEVVGEVISDKMDKTISVVISRMVRHVKYGKYMKKTSVFKAHDEKNEAKTGDIVKIHETRPLSKTKRWSLVEIVEAAKN